MASFDSTTEEHQGDGYGLCVVCLRPFPCPATGRRGVTDASGQWWRDDVRPGWLVTDQPEADGWFYAVRNSDGKVAGAKGRQGLMSAMMVEDVVRTWREAGMVD